MPSVPPPAGGHQLQSSFGTFDASEQSPPRHGRRGVWIVTALGVVIVGAICAGTQWTANVGYDDALASFERTLNSAESAQTQLTDTLTTLTETTDVATTVTAADTGNLMDPAAKEIFASAIDEASDADSIASGLVDAPLPRAPEKPSWAWELFGTTTQLDIDRDETAEDVEEFKSARTSVMSASDAVSETGTAAVLSAAEAARTFEAAHVSARNLDIVALRNAVEWLSDAAMLDATTAEAYVELESAAVAILISEQAEIAEKQGALYQPRIEIEAFARELAPGVLLDFDWSARVNGYGEADSMAGYATWWHGDPGYATIELTNSVAELWPGDRSKALVAHEVGHAISVKCDGAYDDSTQESIEAWATAWAISMGFHDVANGTSAYGAPPQSMIDAAVGCR